MTVVLNSLDFSLVTDNDDMIEIEIVRRSDDSYAKVQSAKWEMFAPGTRNAVVTKEGSDIIITDKGVKFLIDHTETINLPAGLYTHEVTIITTDGRIHTVTEGDYFLRPGKINLRTIYTPPPS